MKSQELSKEVVTFVAEGVLRYLSEATDRVTGIGEMQYQLEENLQKFEKMNLDDLFDYAKEELQDVAVYATMLHIRLERLKSIVTGEWSKAKEGLQ